MQQQRTLEANADAYIEEACNASSALHAHPNQLELEWHHSKKGMTSEISDRLSQIDWSFEDRSTAPGVEAIHPYPAKFIGDIPRSLIEALPIPNNTVVFDPFCGSGTTLVEAQRSGRDSIGIDLNPIACLISRVKTSPPPSGLQDVIYEIVRQSRKMTTVDVPDIPNVDHWFSPAVKQAVASLSKSIASDEFQEWSNHLRLALSSIIVRVSNQDSDTRYAAVEKGVGRDDVFTLFESAALKVERSLSNRDWDLCPSKIIEGDTLTISPMEIGSRVGLVVTSPPYPNAYEYWLYHKYRMWWLGFDPIGVKEKEIGARAHFFKKNHHTADSFVGQMQSTMSLINSVLVPDGFACFVVGRSKIHGKIVNNADIIERAGNEVGLDTIWRFDRPIKSSRKAFNLSHANIKTETVLVFRKK
ncbi:MAG: DNA methyltransferase [Leptospirillia bacterium]